MKPAVLRIVLGMTLAASLPVSALFAEEEVKALPTLLIKGEVVSLDANDPSAVLLKVKDRYGFETPIFLSQQTKIAQGDATIAPANLTTGTAVEVEYNFDINTAKRHAVSVKVSTPAASAAVVTPPSAAPAAATPAVEPPAQPSEAQPAAAQPAAPAQAAPATQ
jgi:hypothetical protein